MALRSRSFTGLISFTILAASLAALSAGSTTPAQAEGMMRDDRGGMHDGGRRGMGIGTGVGIGVGIGIATEAIRRQREVEAEKELKKGKPSKKPEKKTTKKGGDDKSAK